MAVNNWYSAQPPIGLPDFVNAINTPRQPPREYGDYYDIPGGPIDPNSPFGRGMLSAVGGISSGLSNLWGQVGGNRQPTGSDNIGMVGAGSDPNAFFGPAQYGPNYWQMMNTPGPAMVDVDAIWRQSMGLPPSPNAGISEDQAISKMLEERRLAGQAMNTAPTSQNRFGYSPPQATTYPPTQYQPPAPNSATAQNPFLNVGLSAFQNTQGPYDPTWLNNFGQSLWNQANQNWNDTINPSLNSAAITAGGYGGDRAALAKGVAADRLNQSVFNALAPAALQDYNAWQNRALQGGQSAAGVGQGLESLDLQQRLGMAGIGLNQYQADTARQLGLGNLGVAQRLADIQGWKAQADIANPQYTNPFAAAIGGGFGIYQLLNMIYGNQG